jgi:hypothetical protein
MIERIYKNEKIEYLKNFSLTHNRAAEPEDLYEFHSSSILRIEQYKKLAVQLVNEFQQQTFADTIRELDVEYEKELDDIKAQYERKLNEELLKAKPSFWHGIFQSAIGSIVFTILIGAMLLIFIGIRLGIGGIVTEVSYMFGTQTVISEPVRAADSKNELKP